MQLNHFFKHAPREEVIFHLGSANLINPFQYKAVNNLAFIELKDDLYKVLEFARDSPAFGSVSFGNQKFKL